MKNKIELLILDLLSDKSTHIDRILNNERCGIKLFNQKVNVELSFYDIAGDPQRYFIDIAPYQSRLGSTQKMRTLEIKDEQRVKRISEEFLFAMNLSHTKSSMHIEYMNVFNNYLAGMPVDEKYSFTWSRRKLELRTKGMRSVIYVEKADIDYMIKKLSQTDSLLQPENFYIKNIVDNQSNTSVTSIPLWFNNLCVEKYEFLKKKHIDPVIDGLCETEEDFFKNISKFKNVNFSPVLKMILLDDKLREKEGENIIRKIKI